MLERCCWVIQQAWVLGQFDWVESFILHALPFLWLLLDPLEISQSGLIEALLPTWSWCWALEGRPFQGPQMMLPLHISLQFTILEKKERAG